MKILKIVKKIFKMKRLWGYSAALFLFLLGAFFIWTTTFNLPDLTNFEERKVSQSTKIYDRTGEIVLYDVFGEYKRTVVPLDQISDKLKQATVAVEDKDFYKHNGIQISSIFRAVFKNIVSGSLLGGQGGSTITQQVIKNALLTRDKTLSRKLKEWVLAPRLEKVFTKDQILEIYLNEIPYGGNVYGIEEASRRFFGKQAKDLTLTESAYLASLPQAPTYYSPYGKNVEKLEARKNFVLDQMIKTGSITEEEAKKAKEEKITFQKQEEFGIKAPHFVMYIIDKLNEEYGKEVVEQGGLRVTTTLDWELQEKAEEVANKWALENEKLHNAENSAFVATDPKSGEVLVMVGSRDYFDKTIDGAFNITTAERQPGSVFKPIIYASAFGKGYRPETVVFDLQTEFSTACSSGGDCYNPQNYDGAFRGPISLRNALAQSINIPAVKVFYLAGLKETLALAKKMGITTLNNIDQYGLTLVLGGGEVKPIDIATTYSVFANEGVRYDQTSILKIEDKDGNVLFDYEEEKTQGERVITEQTARLISDILTDNAARAPIFGSNSYMYFPGQDVAAKTGTTNDYKDAWIAGYTPNLTVVAWVGNNDNTSMDKKVAGYIVSPMWNEFMRFAVSKRTVEYFSDPESIPEDSKPIIAGEWDAESEIHDILHWVDRNNPLGPYPSNPERDPQYRLWEEPVRNWVTTQKIKGSSSPKGYTGEKNTIKNDLTFINPEYNTDYLLDSVFVVVVKLENKKISSGEVFIDDKKIGDIDVLGSSYAFIPSEKGLSTGKHSLKVSVVDSDGKKFENETVFGIR